MATATQRTYYTYRPLELVALVPPAALVWIWPNSGIIDWLLLVVAIYATVRDWHGLISMRGRAPWLRLGRKGAFWGVLAILLLAPLAWALYVVLSAFDTYRYWQGRHARTAQRIQQLERELHIYHGEEDSNVSH